MKPKQVPVHLLVPSQRGPIKGGGMANVPAPFAAGIGDDVRYEVACNPKARLPRHASGEARAATCEECRKTKAWQEINDLQNNPENRYRLVEADPEEFGPDPTETVRAAEVDDTASEEDS